MSGYDRDATLGEHIMELLTRIRKIVMVLVIFTIGVLIIPVDLNALTLSWTDPVYNTLATVVINQLIRDLLPTDVQLLPMDWFAPFTI
jgi:Sec-independent protein secretion pathway component TatC